MLSTTEKYLLESIQQGDYKAYEVLFKTYYSTFCKYAVDLVHNSETAKDIVSDLFVKIWEQPENFLATSSLRQYLFRCLHNSCINYLRRSPLKFQDLDQKTLEKLYAQIPMVSEENTSSYLSVSELEQHFFQAIKKLPVECAKIFSLSRREGLSNKEIAKVLNISENTVKVQIYRALIKLREALQPFLE